MQVAARRSNTSVQHPDGLPGLASIITVCFNSLSSLDRTVDSIAAQSYSSLEYIVIDGGSTDGTVQRLSERAGVIDRWLSEPDAGISDAFNKGIALATGEFVLLVNSDDWLEPDHVSNAVAALRQSQADYVFGNIVLHSPDGRVAGTLRGEADYSRRIRHVMPFLNHPSVVARASVYRKYGLFALSLRNAMDYEWALRVHAGGGRGEYVPVLNSHMSLEGVSDAAFNRSLAEVRVISIAYGYPASLAWIRFAYRVIKGALRRFSSRLLPQPLYRRLRALANASYHGN